MELLLHGSCPSCHHWFNRYPIRIFRYASRAQIIYCTNCRERFFGLGGNSTHNSFNSQSTIQQSPSRESSSRPPPVSKSARIASPLEVVNEVATLGIIRSDHLGGARSSQNLPHYARSPTSNLATSYIAEKIEVGDQIGQRRPNPLSHRLSPMMRAAKERIKRTVNRIRYRHTVRRPTPAENREPESRQLSDPPSVHFRASQQESGSAERSIAWSNNQDQHRQELDDMQDTEPPPAGMCPCGVDCFCVTSSTPAGYRSSASSLRMRDLVSGSPVTRSINGHSQEANVSRPRAASPSLVLAFTGAWAASHRSSI